MRRKIKQKDDKEAAKALVSKALAESDVEEEREVDLSAVPTPKIGFIMPNLSSTSENVQILTPNVLNNYIVKMRRTVNQAKFFVESSLKKRMASLEKKTISQKEKQQIEKWKEEMEHFKKVPNDDISKFALVNKKRKNELPLSATTPVIERCIYQIAMEKSVQKLVLEYRKTYNDCDARTGYFLQRLGHRQAEAKEGKKLEKANKKGKSKKEDKEEESDKKSVEEHRVEENNQEDEEIASEEEVVEDSETEDEEKVSDVEMGSGSEDDEIIANRRKLLLTLCNIKIDKTRAKIKPKPKKLEVSDDEYPSANEDEEAANLPNINKIPDDEREKINTVGRIAVKVLDKAIQELEKQKKIKVDKFKKGIKEDIKQESSTKKRLQVDHTTTSNANGVIKKIKLSEGGSIKMKKKKPKEEPKEEIVSDNEESSDDAEDSGFFLSDKSKDNASKEKDVEIAETKNIKAKQDNKKGKQLEAKKIKLNKKVTPNTNDPKTLHPSWAAKVEQKKSLTNVKSQGKRIVFSDD